MPLTVCISALKNQISACCSLTRIPSPQLTVLFANTDPLPTAKRALTVLFANTDPLPTANRKELESTKKRFNEVSEKLMERNRQHQKLQCEMNQDVSNSTLRCVLFLQSMYDALRRRTITPSSFDGQLGRAPPAALRGHDSSFDMPIATGQGREEVLRPLAAEQFVQRAESRQHPTRKRVCPVPVKETLQVNMKYIFPVESHFLVSPAEEFVLRPSSTPVQLNLSHQDLSSAHVVQNRFNMELGTPSKRAGGYRRGAD
ncbi:CCNB1IP1 [Branchiostoma lanceolatum]|uniref:CCNB1IP1 protein n=1 Tax=Branchiostoma lanceolatum TaxID=7740 RepID=A0A8K0ACF1_BRALA|nr:CCNB1IP1 [Branchiostoma lanceolatum]